MRSLLGCALATVSFLSLIVVSPATAAMVTVEVTGRVTDSPFTTIGLGSVVEGYYRYDDTTPDSYPGPEQAKYEGVTFSLTFEGSSTISTDEAWIGVGNKSGGLDEYSVNFQLYHPSYPDRNTLTGAFAGLDVNFGARIHFSDPDGLAWDSVALPDPESVLGSLPDENSFLSLIDPDVYYPAYRLEFAVTDLSVVAVPVPGALALVSVGLGSVGWLLRRRHGSA